MHDYDLWIVSNNYEYTAMDLIEWEILKNPGASERFQPAKDFVQQFFEELPLVAAMQELSLVPAAVDPVSFVEPIVPEAREDRRKFITTGVT